MKKQYLHLSASRCDRCKGPVIAGWLGVRENAISKETDIKQVGAICISCGHRHDNATEPRHRHYLMPMEWEFEDATDHLTQATGLVAALDRADLH